MLIDEDNLIVLSLVVKSLSFLEEGIYSLCINCGLARVKLNCPAISGTRFFIMSKGVKCISLSDMGIGIIGMKLNCLLISVEYNCRLSIRTEIAEATILCFKKIRFCEEGLCALYINVGFPVIK